MSAQPNLYALEKQMYTDLIKYGYENKGMLQKLVINDPDTQGNVRSFPLIGIQNSYERIGSEVIQPNQPDTSNVLMYFKNWEDTAELNIVDQYKIANPTYIQTLVERQTNSIISRVEQIVIDAFSAAPVLDQNTISFTNIDYGYRINGDGSAYVNTGAEQVLDLKGIIKVKEMYDDMGVPPEERYLYIPSNAFTGLVKGSDADVITSRFYTDQTILSQSGYVYDPLFQMNLIVAQGNPLGGLPASGAGKYAFAFTRDTVQLNITRGLPGDGMWFENIKQSWIFMTKVRAGAAAIRPSTLIKIACKTYS